MPSYEPPAPLFVTEASTPPLTRPTSHSFSLHRPNLDAKKTRNAKRLSLVVPPSPGVLENLAAISTPSFPPSSFSRRPFTPARMPTITSSTTSEVPITPTTSGASKRHSQFLLENALPTPRFPVANAKARRPISAYFSDFSVECGTASPYTSEPVCVLPHLYLGAEHNASDSATLSRLGISHVLNVAVEIAQQSQEELVEKNGIRYHHLSWTHHQKNLSSEFPEAFDHIEQARSTGGKILVHCQLGVSRSASLVIAYVMKAENKSLTEAYDFVKDRSGVISPNMSLMYQLAEFEKSLRGTGSGSGSGSASSKRDNRIFDQEEPYHGGFPSEEDMDVDDHSPRPTLPQAPSSKRNSLVLNLGPGSGSSSEQKPFKPMTRPRSTYRHSLLGAEAAASVAAAVPKTPLTDRFSFDRTSLAYPPLSALNNPGNGSTRLTTVEASPTTPSFVTDFASMGSSFSDAPSSASCSMSSRPSSTSSTTISTYSASFSRAMGNGGSTLPSPPSPTVVPRRSSKGAVDRDSVVSPRRSGSWGAHAPLSMVPPPSPWMNTSHGSQRKRQSFQALERDDTEDTASSAGLTTTTTTTTPGASEFIFSPRPCSPPLLETHNFGDFYQALRMEG